MDDLKTLEFVLLYYKKYSALIRGARFNSEYVGMFNEWVELPTSKEFYDAVCKHISIHTDQEKIAFMSALIID